LTGFTLGVTPRGTRPAPPVDRLRERDDTGRVHTYDVSGDHHFYLLQHVDTDDEDHAELVGYADSADTHSETPGNALATPVADALRESGSPLDYEVDPGRVEIRRPSVEETRPPRSRFRHSSRRNPTTLVVGGSRHRTRQPIHGCLAGFR
jgi:hypothetical protein